MIKLGFSLSFVSLIMLCIRSVSYSFLVNGYEFGHLNPERGIRQGDPLSPYLFLFVSEAFLCLIREAEERLKLIGIRVSALDPHVSHLLFADDTLIFCEVTKEAADELWNILQLYENASGQMINRDKSKVVFSGNIQAATQMEVVAALGIPIGEHHEKYLGLPTVIDRTKKEIFAYIRDKIWQRIQG